MIDGVSDVNAMLQEKIGEAMSGVLPGTTKTKDHSTVVKENNNTITQRGKDHITESSDASDTPVDYDDSPKTSSGVRSASGSSVLGAVGSSVIEGIPMVAGGLFNTGKSGFNDVMSALKKGGLGNGSVDDHAKSFVANIYLPLPNEIQEALSHSYEEQAGWMGAVKENTPFLNSGIDMGVAMAGFISKITGSRSVTFDRNRVSMYTESAFRTISLSWSLVPNNKEESKAIHKIIKSLKKYSSPDSVAGKILLKSPHFFRIKFGNELIDEALQFYEVVIEEIGIDYSPGGHMEMHHDDTPKTMNLSITFKDREPKLMGHWDEGAPKASAPAKPSCSAGGQSKGKGNSSTNTDPDINSNKKAGAGGGSDAKNNSGQKQAEAPKDEDWRDGSNDLPNDWNFDPVKQIYLDSENNPLLGLSPKSIDIDKKYPAENPYDGQTFADYIKG